jgi:hypothetical protein
MRRLLHSLLACAFLALGSGLSPAPAQPARACCGMDMGGGCPCPPSRTPEAPCQGLTQPVVKMQGAELQAAPAPASSPWPASILETGLEAGPAKAVSPDRAPDPRRRQALLRCWRT